MADFLDQKILLMFHKLIHQFFLKKTETILSLPDLYKKFAGTDVKGLVSLHALAALNIYFGGNQVVSQTTFGEFLKNLTYQALSDENDNISIF